VHFEAGYVPRHYRVEDFAQAIRAIGEPIHARPADQISMARVLTLLFEVTALFDMQTRIELVMLQKTMVVVEGVARKLDPRLNMWTTAEPVVGDWIAQNLGPVGRLEDVRDKLGAFARALAEAPKKVERFEAFLTNMEKAAAEPVELSTVALWVIAVSLIAIAIRLYVR
jgi:ubiquinone biosynthesis protein